MKIYLNYDYSKNKENVDVLCRGYDNQSKNPKEKEQCCGDICWKPGVETPNNLLTQATAWLPRGIAEYITKQLKLLEHTDYSVGIANEFPDKVGELTSCDKNFHNAILSGLRTLNAQVVNPKVRKR